MTFERQWAMPNAFTFSIAPIQKFILDRCEIPINQGKLVIDPFAGFYSPCKSEYQNDLNPESPAKYHEDARQFLQRFKGIDILLFDPPYSPRQIQEVYLKLGLTPTKTDTQHARFIAECKDLAADRIKVGGIVICCGWNSTGFGKGRGFELISMLVVNHGASHNDTIITVERKK